jgi:hypothetical protein
MQGRIGDGWSLVGSSRSLVSPKYKSGGRGRMARVQSHDL